MTVIVANDTPDAIRGMLKRWFIEPRPNVFVGTLNARTHVKVMEYIVHQSPEDFGMLIISTAANCEGYQIERIGPCGCRGRKPVTISGVSLVAEAWVEAGDCPF